MVESPLTWPESIGIDLTKIVLIATRAIKARMSRATILTLVNLHYELGVDGQLPSLAEMAVVKGGGHLTSMFTDVKDNEGIACTVRIRTSIQFDESRGEDVTSVCFPFEY